METLLASLIVLAEVLFSVFTLCLIFAPERVSWLDSRWFFPLWLFAGLSPIALGIVFIVHYH